MRRLRQSLKRTYFWRKASTTKNAEGHTTRTYADAVEVEAIIRHASGRVAAMQYGEKLAYILHMQYEGDADIRPGDGVCVYVPADANPDYVVKASKGLTDDAFRVYELEAV